MAMMQSVDPGGWLTDDDERPHPPGGVPLWSENWLTYAWCPDPAIGVYFHVCRRPGPVGVYEETFNVYLPADRFLTSRGFGAIQPGDPVVAGLSFRCDAPFKAWTQRFHGAARLVSGEELRAGPLADGPYVDVDLELTIQTMSPPFDIGGQHLEQSWGTGHYEQHHQATGHLTYGDERIELRGAGLRDHSWGPRDWRGIGDTTWYHGQFPESGRSFMGISVPGRPPYKPFRHATISDRTSVERAELVEVPDVTSVYYPSTGYELVFATTAGTERIECQILQSMPMAFMPPAEIGLGTHPYPEASHDFVETMTRFVWDGEVGYGMATGAKDLSADR
jgi:hypothetical protein